MRTLARRLALVCAIFALQNGLLARAAEISVSGERCAKTVRVVAHAADLATLLAALASSLDFDVSFKAEHHRVVNVDTAGDPEDVVASIVNDENTSRVLALDAGCNNRMRLAKLWILPARGREGAASQTAIAPPDRDVQARASSSYDGNYLLITTLPKEERR